MSRLSIQLITLMIAPVALACFALPANAQSAVDVEVWDEGASAWVDFSSETLFREGNILPGDEVKRTVRVANAGSESRDLAVELIDNTGCAGDCLSDALYLAIFHDSNLLREGTLTSFYPAGETGFDQLPGNATREYLLEVTFMAEAGNEYQGGEADFDIQIGAVSSQESIGEEVSTGGSGGSGGSSFFYNDLRIFNERATDVQPTSATITWDTNREATSRVIYSPEGFDHMIDPNDPPKYDYAQTTAEYDTPANPDGVINHTIELTGLFPDTIYYFRCVSHASPEEQGAELMFKTPGEDVRVLGEEGAPLLAVTKTVDREFANAGETGIVYTVTVANDGAIPAQGVKVRDELPEGLVFSGTDKTAKAWEIGELLSGQFEKVSYTVDAADSAEPGTYTNTATASAVNNKAVTATADLEIRSVDVEGFSNIPSGFDVGELYVMVIIMIVLAGGGWRVSRKVSGIRYL